VRFRKLIGAVALFVLVLAWALIAMAVAQFPAIRDTTVLSILYYVIAGCGLGVAGRHRSPPVQRKIVTVSEYHSGPCAHIRKPHASTAARTPLASRLWLGETLFERHVDRGAEAAQ
jgi:hypothetical protein